MKEMPTANEYMLRLVLELIEKCKTLDELKKAIEKVIDESK